MDFILDPGLQSHDSNVQATIVKIEAGKRVLELAPEYFSGGIAIWGALPAVFNNSSAPDDDNGVHVHARTEVDGIKQIDETFDIVRVRSQNVEGHQMLFDINGTDAANYNISTIFNKRLTYLICPSCGKVHSDNDIHALFYHTKHECEHCGDYFLSSEPCISNSIMLLKEACADAKQFREINNPVNRRLDVKCNTFKGGIQIWGSNPAVLWTSAKLEEGGIHLHGFQSKQVTPTVDNTYGILTIDDLIIDPEMTRYLMAQNVLTHLKNRVLSLSCDVCGRDHFDRFDLAVIPHTNHKCEFCSNEFNSPYNLACVSNPLVKSLNLLAQCLKQHTSS